MKTDVETLSPTRVRLSVEVPFAELQPSVDSAYKKIAAQITIPGFRKGKVPAQIIDQRVGRGAVLDEAVNEALPRAYSDAVTENDIKVLGLDVGVLKDLRTARLDTKRVGDRQLIEEGARRLQNCRSEDFFVFSRQR